MLLLLLWLLLHKARSIPSQTKTPEEVKSLDEESRRNIKVGTLPQQRRPEKIRLAQDPQKKEEGVRVALRRGGGALITGGARGTAASVMGGPLASVLDPPDDLRGGSPLAHISRTETRTYMLAQAGDSAMRGMW